MSNLQWTLLSLLVMSSAQLCSAAVGDSIYTIPELLMSGEQINSTCGFVTCDIRMEYCQEMIPGREDKKKCSRCENTCGPGRIQNNPRQQAFCLENCTVYMLSLDLEKRFPNGLQKVGATSTIQMSEGSTLPYIRLAGPSGAECPPYQMLTLVIVIAIFMFLIFICVLSVIIYRKLNKRAGKTLGSDSSLESDANEMFCCALPRGNRNQPVVQPDAVYQARSVQVSLSPPLGQQSAISTTSISPHHGSTIVSSSPPHDSRTSPCTTGSQPSSRDGQLSQGQTSYQGHTAQGHTPERCSSATPDSSSHLMAAHSSTPGGSTRAPGGSTHTPGGSTSTSALRHNTPDEVPDSHRDLSLRSDNITGVSGLHGQPHCESGLSGGPNPWAVQTPIQVSESRIPYQPEVVPRSQGSSYSQQVSTASPVISQPSPHSEHSLSNLNLPRSSEADPFLPKADPDPQTRPKQR